MRIAFVLVLTLLTCACQTTVKELDVFVPHLVNDTPLYSDKGKLQMVVEIPAGTLEKWEVNKTHGQLERDQENGAPRSIRYLGYPANYGFFPQTLLPKDEGGDGDPLDVLLLGPPLERGSTAACKIIGVLQLLDRGEQDDKLIALPLEGTFSEIDSLDELFATYEGMDTILETWFSNYKGPNKMQSQGFAGKQRAEAILKAAAKGMAD